MVYFVSQIFKITQSANYTRPLCIKVPAGDILMHLLTFPTEKKLLMIANSGNTTQPVVF